MSVAWSPIHCSVQFPSNEMNGLFGLICQESLQGAEREVYGVFRCVRFLQGFLVIGLGPLCPSLLGGIKALRASAGWRHLYQQLCPASEPTEALVNVLHISWALLMRSEPESNHLQTSAFGFQGTPGSFTEPHQTHGIQSSHSCQGKSTMGLSCWAIDEPEPLA